MSCCPTEIKASYALKFHFNIDDKEGPSGFKDITLENKKLGINPQGRVESFVNSSLANHAGLPFL